MKRKIISDAITNISSEYIEKAADYSVSRKKRKPILIKCAAMAACLCLVVAGAITLFPEQQSNSPVSGVLAEVTEILNDNQFEAVITGEDGNFNKNDVVTVTYESNEKIVIAIGDTVAITYSKFEKTGRGYKISAGQIEIVSARGQQNGTTEVIEFHGTQFNKADLSKETLEWLEQYNSLSPEEQLSISFVPSELRSSKGGEANADDYVVFHGETFLKAELSIETLEWLEWYNSLTPEGQLAVNSIPSDLYTYDNTGTVEEIADE